MSNEFLPISKIEMDNLGWDYYDFLFISGDAYVDHPSFGASLLARLLEANGYRVCMCPQPDRNDPDALTRFGEPRLGVLISGGVIDSMVNHYTASRKKRSGDGPSRGGCACGGGRRTTGDTGGCLRRSRTRHTTPSASERHANNTVSVVPLLGDQQKHNPGIEPSTVISKRNSK